MAAVVVDGLAVPPVAVGAPPDTLRDVAACAVVVVVAVVGGLVTTGALVAGVLADVGGPTGVRPCTVAGVLTVLAGGCVLVAVLAG